MITISGYRAALCMVLTSCVVIGCAPQEPPTVVTTPGTTVIRESAPRPPANVTVITPAATHTETNTTTTSTQTDPNAPTTNTSTTTTGG